MHFAPAIDDCFGGGQQTYEAQKMQRNKTKRAQFANRKALKGRFFQYCCILVFFSFQIFSSFTSCFLSAVFVCRIVDVGI